MVRQSNKNIYYEMRNKLKNVIFYLMVDSNWQSLDHPFFRRKSQKKSKIVTIKTKVLKKETTPKENERLKPLKQNWRDPII